MKNAIYFDKTQLANFRGRPLLQGKKHTLKQRLNGEKEVWEPKIDRCPAKNNRTERLNPKKISVLHLL